MADSNLSATPNEVSPPSMLEGFRPYLFDNSVYGSDGKLHSGSGVGLFQVGDYNKLAAQDASNKYNYWLWQQQNQYNSPKEVMQRLKDAGINPNLIAGQVSGTTAGSPAPSHAPNMGDPFQSVLNTVTAFVSSVRNGINAVSELSGIPDDIGTFRQLLTQQAKLSLSRNQLDVFNRQLDTVLNAAISGGWTDENGNFKDSFFSSLGLPDMSAFAGWNPARSIPFNLKNLQLGLASSKDAVQNALASLYGSNVDLNKVKAENLKSSTDLNASKKSLNEAQQKLTEGRNLDFTANNKVIREFLDKYENGNFFEQFFSTIGLLLNYITNQVSVKL